jgi:hypothetical protein
MMTVSNSNSFSMDDRIVRTFPPIWRMMLPLPEMRWPA